VSALLSAAFAPPVCSGRHYAITPIFPWCLRALRHCVRAAPGMPGTAYVACLMPFRLARCCTAWDDGRCAAGVTCLVPACRRRRHFFPATAFGAAGRTWHVVWYSLRATDILFQRTLPPAAGCGFGSTRRVLSIFAIPFGVSVRRLSGSGVLRDYSGVFLVVCSFEFIH